MTVLYRNIFALFILMISNVSSKTMHNRHQDVQTDLGHFELLHVAHKRIAKYVPRVFILLVTYIIDRRTSNRQCNNEITCLKQLNKAVYDQFKTFYKSSSIDNIIDTINYELNRPLRACTFAQIILSHEDFMHYYKSYQENTDLDIFKLLKEPAISLRALGDYICWHADIDGISMNTLIYLVKHCNKMNRYAVIKMLILAGAHINYQDKQGDTALHHAIRLKCLADVRLLVKQGAALSVVNKEGYTAVALAVYLYCATATKSVGITMFDSYISCLEKNVHELTALYQIIVYILKHMQKRYLAIDNETMRINQDIIDQQEAFTHCTPLMLAARLNHIEMVKLLISLGATVTCADYAGKTAYEHAQQCQNKQIARFLAQYLTVADISDCCIS